MLPGEKAKLVNLLDNVQADKASLTPTYSIELVLSRSPQKGVKCGAIAVFKMNDLDVDIASEKIAEKMREAASEMTQIMYCDPEYFREPDGRWLPWAITRVMELFDKFGSAEIVIKVPKLRIKHKLTSSDVSKGRGNTKKLFEVAFLADKLLEGDFQWDPWTGSAKRGIVGAKK